MEDIVERRKILLVADDSASAILTQQAIGRSSISAEISVVRECDDALRHLRRKDYLGRCEKTDMILLDIALSDRRGWDLLRTIKGDSLLRSIPVIVLTLSHDDQYIQKCYALHADGFVNKPMNAKKIDDLINSKEEFMLFIEPTPINELPSDIWY